MEKSSKDVFIKYKSILLQDKLPVGEFEIQKLALDFHEVKNILSSDLNNFEEVFSNTSCSKGQIITKLSELFVGFGLVSHLDYQEKDLKPEDFPCTAFYAENCFKYIKLIFETWDDLENSNKRQILINILILCATHSKNYSWSNENVVVLSSDFLSWLLTFTNHKTVCSLLCEDFHPTLYKGILKKIRPSLMKDTWQQYPSSCYVFSWLLHHVQHPYLVDYLNDIFPPPCMFISDHRVCHQKLAIQIFHHILDNVPPSLIKLDGKEEVIWNFLMPFMYSTEEEIVKSLSPCLLNLPSFRTQKMTQICWLHYDEALSQLLIRAEMDFNSNLKRMYLSHILSFIQIIPPFKHLKDILKVIENSFYKDSDILCHITSMKILKDLIKFCWPRMEKYCFKILKDIIILYCEVESRKPQLQLKDINELYDLSKSCLTSLKSICSNEFESLVTKYVNENSENPGVDILKDICLNT